MLKKVAFTMYPVLDLERANKLDVFASPVCRMAVIIDSEGNAVTLHQKNRKD